jgi:predicted phosphoribosyltransferase/predicted alpha/beta-hydrolase family hydrolase
VFRNRSDAGRQLAQHLSAYAGVPDLLVLGLARGGVPVAAEVAEALGAPLDVCLVRKLGLPGRPELAMGAVAAGGVTVLNHDVLAVYAVSDDDLRAVATRELTELDRRLAAYRSGPAADVTGRTVLLVDDGLATGSTMRAACLAMRQQSAGRVVVAVPVAPAGVAAALSGVADDVVVALTPERFRAVGQWFEDFDQTTDDEVRRLLGERRRRRGEVTVQVAAGALGGELTAPASGARGVVLFAHGSGSSRHSPRNRAVARSLVDAGYATLLMDLLTAAEERGEQAGARRRFDVAMLAERLGAALDWLGTSPATAQLPVVLFGASTGAAAALILAADRPDAVRAVVSRGGRPDLAGEALDRVIAPTLLVVGGADETVLRLNRDAAARLTRAEVALVVVPGATHLFEEPGALEEVARLAASWFDRWGRAAGDGQR